MPGIHQGKEQEMASLKLSFAEGKQRPLTGYEINELAIAATAARNISRVMAEYAGDCSGDVESLGLFISAFTVLEWLTEPVANYLDEYAGQEAAPEKGE
jgi:hypothetical protein